MQASSKPYYEKLKDPRWQKKRLLIFKRDGFSCLSCFDKTSTLHVHHLWYENDKEPWEIEDDALITLCEDCHNTETEKMGEIIKFFKRHFLSGDMVKISNLIDYVPNELNIRPIRRRRAYVNSKKEVPIDRH